MSRDDEAPNGEAERLSHHPLLNEILDAFEQDALNGAVNTDDEERRNQHVHEVRAVRNLRQKLKTLAEGKTKLSPPKAVA